MKEQYYPCIMDWEKNQISQQLGPAMSHEEAVIYLKQHHSGAWERATAKPQPVSHEFFAQPREV
jgi:hypothetical protein